MPVAGFRPGAFLCLCALGLGLFTPVFLSLAQNTKAPARKTASVTKAPAKFDYASDAEVVRESQEQAMEMAKALLEKAEDPQRRTLIEAAIKEMERAEKMLAEAKGSPKQLKPAVDAAQAALQALLKLAAREHQVQKSKSQKGGGGGGGGNQKQLEQLDLKMSENKYENRREAKAEQNPQQREQLVVQSRLQELARRQQDVNERLKELQTALQEAKTEEEREEVRRRLKRLREEQEQMLADVDELQQRMERPENQSRMSDERNQLDKTRQDLQQAAQSMDKGAVSQALASGARAQKDLQELRDNLRKQTSSQFSEEMRDLRNDTRELAQKQEEIGQKLDDARDNKRKALSGVNSSDDLAKQMAEQKQQMTNLLERATQIAEQTEESEPLLHRQLYDLVRQMSQEDAKHLREATAELSRSGVMTRSLYDMLQKKDEAGKGRTFDIAAELLKQSSLPQAGQLEQRARAMVNQFKTGVERASESVLGDEAEALRLAKQELDALAEQLNQELARNSPQEQGDNASTNRTGSGSAQLQRELEQAQARRAALAVNGQPGDPEVQKLEEQIRQLEKQLAQSQQAEQRAGNQDGKNGKGGKAGERREMADARSGQKSGGKQGEGQQPGQQSEANSESQQQNGKEGKQGEGQKGEGKGGKQGGGKQGEGSQQAQANQDGKDGKDGKGGGGKGGAQANAGPRQRPSLGDRDGGQRTGGNREGGGGRWNGGFLDNWGGAWNGGPIYGEEYTRWSERLRDVEEMIDQPDLRNEASRLREVARQFRVEGKKSERPPEWDMVRKELAGPLMDLRKRIVEELARRESHENLVPIDRDPVPAKFSELVRRYYEQLGSDK
jgi:hypothetical protein